MTIDIWNDYESMPLPDVLSFIVDNRGKTVPTDENGTHILIATNCIRNENLYPSYDKVRLLNDDIYENWFRAHPLPGDIIFVNKGTPGRVCMVPDPVDFCIAQDMMAFRVNEDIIYNKYLLAVLRNPRIQAQIAATTVGDVIPHFKKQQLGEIRIPIPPMKIQKRIGDLYFMFCAKEECNKKINNNLEQQAQAVYYKMFSEVNGEPVELSSIIDVRDGTHDSPKAQATGYYLITSKHLLPFGVDKASANRISKADFDKINERSLVETQDILMSMIGTIGLISYIPYEAVDFAIKNMALFKTSHTPELTYYFLCYLKSEKTLQHIEKCLAGSTQKYISLGELRKMPIYSPTTDEIREFNYLVKPMFEEIVSRTYENALLAEMRDTLLPKLMSGELDVSDIDL